MLIFLLVLLFYCRCGLPKQSQQSTVPLNDIVTLFYWLAFKMAYSWICPLERVTMERHRATKFRDRSSNCSLVIPTRRTYVHPATSIRPVRQLQIYKICFSWGDPHPLPPCCRNEWSWGAKESHSIPCPTLLPYPTLQTPGFKVPKSLTNLS